MLDALRGNAGLSFAALLIVLIICNIGFAYSNGWSRWGWQIFGFLGLFATYKLGGLSLSDIGLSKAHIGDGLKYAAVAILAISVALLVAYLVNKHLFSSDKRYDQSLKAALGTGLFLLPLKVVLFEEIAFRGIMPALLKDLGSKPWMMLVISSLIFGLWHILTAPDGSKLTGANDSNLLIVLGVFVATSAGGVILYLLRQQSDSLVASILVHWYVNCSIIILSSLAWMKT